MNRFSLILLFGLLFSTCSLQESEAAQIKHCFDKCKSAIVNKDGREVAGYISEKTIAEYSNLLDKIRRLDSSRLNNEEFSEKLFVLEIRQLLSGDQIRQLNSQRLLSLAIEKGISQNSNIGNFTLDKITIADSSAKASLILDNKLSPFVYMFYREKGLWKIKLRIGQYRLSYRQLFPDSRITENEYIRSRLREISGKEPSNAIWHPIQSHDPTSTVQ